MIAREKGLHILSNALLSYKLYFISIKKNLTDFFRGTGSTVDLESFNENHERRADLLVTSPQGKTTFDFSVVSISSKKNFRSVDPLREALTSLVVKNNSSESAELINLSHLVLGRRIESKNKKNANLNFGGQFQAFVLSTGGLVSNMLLEHIISHRKTDPAEVLRLKYRLSVSLTSLGVQAVYSRRLGRIKDTIH
eukprot:snap_masked-scaffold_65-processed-gene-0.47-mRNA-1 protein AED:1.00 eAED:1.00 QI:0/0/0/0/1/1/3/0/194